MPGKPFIQNLLNQDVESMKWREYFFCESALINSMWKRYLYLAFALPAIISLSGCPWWEDEEINTPGVTTMPVSEITANHAKGGGRVNDAGGGTIKSRGLVWNTSSDPSLESNLGQVSGGSGLGTFEGEMTELYRGTTYYVRAYAVNEAGAGYGNEVTFKTEGILPAITTKAVTNVSQSSATSGGDISDDGGAQITARGVCWSTAQEPSIQGNKTSDGMGTGDFTSTITGLSRNTRYYVRAYATNSVGTQYGNELSFTTIAAPPSLNLELTKQTLSSISARATISDDGGAPITARGFCWGTASGPTISGNKVSVGSGAGTFESRIAGLSPGETYFMRAYATNSISTAYSNQIEVRLASTMNDTEGNSYKVVKIGNQIWMAENLKTTKYNDRKQISNKTSNADWLADSEGAYCWYNNSVLVYKNTYGALYNWYAVDSKKLCPAGWHVPSTAEWSVLAETLGGADVAGGKLKAKETWQAPNIGASNSSGFNALPGGGRSFDDGSFFGLKEYGGWWSSNQQFHYLRYDSNSLSWGYGSHKPFRWQSTGLSVRCVQDAE
jgi:uncharacterized protein (TIGR02145 family)